MGRRVGEGGGRRGCAAPALAARRVPLQAAAPGRGPPLAARPHLDALRPGAGHWQRAQLDHHGVQDLRVEGATLGAQLSRHGSTRHAWQPVAGPNPAAVLRQEPGRHAAALAGQASPPARSSCPATRARRSSSPRALQAGGQGLGAAVKAWPPARPAGMRAALPAAHSQGARSLTQQPVRGSAARSAQPRRAHRSQRQICLPWATAGHPQSARWAGASPCLPIAGWWRGTAALQVAGGCERGGGGRPASHSRHHSAMAGRHARTPRGIVGAPTHPPTHPPTHRNCRWRWRSTGPGGGTAQSRTPVQVRAGAQACLFVGARGAGQARVAGPSRWEQERPAAGRSPATRWPSVDLQPPAAWRGAAAGSCRPAQLPADSAYLHLKPARVLVRGLQQDVGAGEVACRGSNGPTGLGWVQGCGTGCSRMLAPARPPVGAGSGVIGVGVGAARWRWLQRDVGAVMVACAWGALQWDDAGSSAGDRCRAVRPSARRCRPASARH